MDGIYRVVLVYSCALTNSTLARSHLRWEAVPNTVTSNVGRCRWELGITVSGSAIDGMRSGVQGILTARGEEGTSNCAVVPVHSLTTSVAVMLSVSVEYCLVFIASLRAVLWHCRPTNCDAL